MCEASVSTGLPADMLVEHSTRHQATYGTHAHTLHGTPGVRSVLYSSARHIGVSCNDTCAVCRCMSLYVDGVSQQCVTMVCLGPFTFRFENCNSMR